MFSILRRISSRFPLNPYLRSQSIRPFSMDDDGDINQFQTTVTILNKEDEKALFIDSYSHIGLRLSNGLNVIGPCAIFPRSILHWNVSGVTDIDEDSLSLFTLLDPRIEILVLGVGEQANLSKINPKIITYLNMKKINAEILSTDQALAVFNFLNAEKRYIAGGFIPPSFIEDSYEPEVYLDDETLKLK